MKRNTNLVLTDLKTPCCFYDDDDDCGGGGGGGGGGVFLMCNIFTMLMGDAVIINLSLV